MSAETPRCGICGALLGGGSAVAEHFASAHPVECRYVTMPRPNAPLEERICLAHQRPITECIRLGVAPTR